jgi:signal peptidase I
VRWRRALVWLAAAAILGTASGAGARSWAFYPTQVTSNSMAPTIVRGDWLVVQKLDSDDRTHVRRSTVVLFRYPFGSTLRAVKRVVALAGDTVEISRRSVTVNGREIPTAGLPHLAPMPGDPLKPLPRVEVVPAAHVFVLGDNAAASIDSRSFGPVPEAELVGRVRLVSPLAPSGFLAACVVIALTGAAFAVFRMKEAR